MLTSAAGADEAQRHASGANTHGPSLAKQRQTALQYISMEQNTAYPVKGSWMAPKQAELYTLHFPPVVPPPERHVACPGTPTAWQGRRGAGPSAATPEWEETGRN